MNESAHHKSRPAVCRLTASGRSAIAVVGLRGPHASDWLNKSFRTAGRAEMQKGQIRYGTWLPTGESVVVTPLDDDRFEIHAHGGAAAVAGIWDSLVALGARPLDPARWDVGTACERASEPSVSETLIAEARLAVLAARTIDDAAPLHDQLGGLLVEWVTLWQHRLTQRLDEALLTELRESASGIARKWPQVEMLLRPRRVVLFGPPNVGKSSLLNRLVGYGRAIIHDVAGTTRDVIDCDTVLDGVPMTLTDTAGVREAEDAIEQEGIRRGRSALQQSDLVVCVVDPEHLEKLSELLEQASLSGHDRSQCLTVLNKADRLTSPVGPEVSQSAGILQTVALDAAALEKARSNRHQSPNDTSSDKTTAGGDGIEGLMNAIASTFQVQRPPRHEPLPVNARQYESVQQLARVETREQAIHWLDSLRGSASSVQRFT